jgi:8-oxo-dGTP pyrophosphatase MutT (NUDIX family)
VVEIVALDRVEITAEPWVWDFAKVRRKDIDQHFARLAEMRSVWNGRVLLLHRYNIQDGVFQGLCFESDYASFIAWREWEFPDPCVYNFYAATALRAADGAYLLGEMAPHTASAGERYFPCGTPEPTDTVDGHVVDLYANLSRELLEETGIAIAELEETPGWILVRDRNFLALMKRVTAHQSAEDLRNRVIRFLEKDSQPELSDIHIVRSRSDLGPRIPNWAKGYLEAVMAGHQASQPMATPRRITTPSRKR